MPTISDLEKQYVSKHEKSRQLYTRALNCFASGVTHDVRFVKPFPIYSARAVGTKRWDVDGNEYVDYIVGHGSLVTGFGDERIIAAFQEQIPKAIHMGMCTELEIEWAELVQRLVPCAREGFVRATSCGSEAIMLAIRLSRMYTGRKKAVIMAGSYHGVGDTVIGVYQGPPFGMCNVQGIPEGVTNDVVIVPYNNLDVVHKTFETGDVACIILQGDGSYTKEYFEGLRELTSQYGVVFIVDEVVSGFRYAVGGAQEYYGVTSDLAVLGKIAGGGGMPIGVICGKKEILELYSFKDNYWNRFKRISSGGTWNAFPLAMAGGIAMMKILDAERSTVYPRLYTIGRTLTKSFNDEAKSVGVAALAEPHPFDNPTIFRLQFFNRPVPAEKVTLWEKGPTTFEDYWVKAQYEAGQQASYANYLVQANAGVTALHWDRAFFACTRHSEEDLRKAEAAFASSLRVLKENKLVGIVK